MKLVAEELAFGYPDHAVGRDASLELDGGEVLCLLGPNGSGKTTLFKTLLGLLPPQRGRIALDGRDLRRMPRREVARAIAYVPQAHAGYFPFTVREMVLMGRTAHLATFATPSRRDVELAEAAIDRVGLGRLADKSYTRVSGGERQLALVARALAQASPLMVMDEPTASLDFGNQARILEQISRLAGEGIGVLLSTHDPDHAFLCADRAAMIRDGRIVACGPVGTTLTAAALGALYGVPVTVGEVETREGGRRRVCVPETRPGSTHELPFRAQD